MINLISMVQEAGFTAWAPLDPSTLDPQGAVRDMCAANTCRQFAARWSCPPGCGSLEECSARLRQYSRGILVQTAGQVEDSFDFEAIQETERLHKEHFRKMHELLRARFSVLALGSGCCTQCQECTYPQAPCRFPEKQTTSMEAYGLMVAEVCRKNGLPYYYGPGKIAFTGCFLF